jgi:hypothetical protein
MIIGNSKVRCTNLLLVKKNFSVPAAVPIRSNATQRATPKKFNEIPCLSRFELFKRFSRGGKFHQMSHLDFQKQLHEELGSIYRMPGMIGQNPIVMSSDAEDIEYVHRNEGAYPFRKGLEVMKFYRTKVRPDIYDVGGLIIE